MRDADALRDVMARRVTRQDCLAMAEELINDNPWCFEENPQSFGELKHHLATELEVQPDEVRLVGSGQNGFSLAPSNNLRSFHDDSDLDFAVISRSLFDRYWRMFAHWGHPRRHKLPANEAKWFQQRADGIFWGWLEPHKLTPPQYLRHAQSLHPLRDLRTRWFTTFRRLSIELPQIPQAQRECSARLYRDEWHLIEYQAESLRRLANNLRRDTSQA